MPILSVAARGDVTRRHERGEAIATPSLEVLSIRYDTGTSGSTLCPATSLGSAQETNVTTREMAARTLVRVLR